MPGGWRYSSMQTKGPRSCKYRFATAAKGASGRDPERKMPPRHSTSSAEKIPAA